MSGRYKCGDGIVDKRYSPNSSDRNNAAPLQLGGSVGRPPPEDVEVEVAKPVTEGAKVPPFSQVIHAPAPPPGDHIDQKQGKGRDYNPFR